MPLAVVICAMFGSVCVFICFVDEALKGLTFNLTTVKKLIITDKRQLSLKNIS